MLGAGLLSLLASMIIDVLAAAVISYGDISGWQVMLRLDGS